MLEPGKYKSKGILHNEILIRASQGFAMGALFGGLMGGTAAIFATRGQGFKKGIQMSGQYILSASVGFGSILAIGSIVRPNK
mmetsp:Transcript_4729/g.13266  ORF Transcript_4729/g.13266 Transcript_4729/m.13266 type:complete len:82 (+) Transcript_4729:261-506(+)